MHLNELAKLMRTAGDESRLKILCIIFNNKKVCVSDIAKELNMSVAIVSHHLQVMSKEELVFPVREGKKICYELPKSPFVNDLKKFICKYK
jgi:DNA-binding transcriptional ArsR family regulator